MKKLSVSAIIFDLDDTLFDTHNTLTPLANEEACQAMIAAGLDANLAECLQTKEQLQKEHPRQDIFSLLAKHFGQKVDSSLKDEEFLANLGRHTFYSREIEEDIKPFAGVIPLLAFLKNHAMLFLVTSGEEKTQQKKIDKLKIKKFFNKIYFVNHLEGQRKLGAFQKIQQFTHFSSQAILCVGDRIDREITDAQKLGFHTCLIHRYGVVTHSLPHIQPEYVVTHVNEIRRILEI